MTSHEAAHAESILVGQALRVRAGDRLLLDVDSVDIRGGEVVAFLGPNGAGKSTLLRVMAMLQRPDSGSVTFRGVSGRDAERLLRRQCAVVFQRPHLWAGSVRENVEIGLRLRRHPAESTREMAEEAAVQLGIDALMERDARSLSGGEAQRVAIARAMALQPDVLFDAFSLADRVVVLRDGRVVQSGRPEDLFENPADPFIAAVTGAELSFRASVASSHDGLLTIRVGDSELIATGSAEAGDQVRVVYRPEDLFLSRAEISASPRNRFQAKVTEVRSSGSLLRVRLEGAGHWVAVITRAAGDELSLDVGSRIWVQVKATALHAFSVQAT